MGKETGIEWTQATWNPWMGCHKVSQGCRRCYMFREQQQYGHDPNVVRRSRTTFGAPLKWSEPSLIFTCSWSDFFIEEADPWRPEAWEVIRNTPRHIYQILTKRPERIQQCLPHGWFPHNVWWGVSIETQDHMNRWQILERTIYARSPAVLFVSAEPLLGPLMFYDWMAPPDWVIVGGESGPEYRPMDLAWARSIRDQCRQAEIPFFLKQLGGWPDRGTRLDQLPEDLRIREMPERRQFLPSEQLSLFPENPTQGPPGTEKGPF